MLTSIVGNALSGVILGDTGTHPPHDKVVTLFIVYAALGLSGHVIILLFLRSHTPGHFKPPPQQQQQQQQSSNSDVHRRSLATGHTKQSVN